MTRRSPPQIPRNLLKGSSRERLLGLVHAILQRFDLKFPGTEE